MNTFRLVPADRARGFGPTTVRGPELADAIMARADTGRAVTSAADCGCGKAAVGVIAGAVAAAAADRLM